jgi:tricarballylate dehydrogenase
VALSAYDVVVVGAGNAALSAAIASAEDGAAVSVVERASKEERGGNSWFTDGAIRFAHGGLRDIRDVIPQMPDSEAARIDLPSYPVASFIDDMQRMSDGRADPLLTETLARESLDTMRWLAGHGVSFSMLYDNLAFEVSGRHHFWGGLSLKVDGKGIGQIDGLMHRAQAFGVDVWYDAHAVSLRQASMDDHRVVVERSGQTIEVPARAVVLACGGFEASEDLRAQHLGSHFKDAVVRGTRYNVGDGLRMALETGAAPCGDWGGCHAVATDANAPRFGDHSSPGDVFKKHSYPLGIVVNTLGERFVDEGADFRNYTYARYGQEILRQPRSMAYQVFDAQVRDRLRAEYWRPEATRLEATTLEELASLMEIHVSGFLDCVRGYNDAVGDGDFDPGRLDGKSTIGIDPPKSNWALRIDQPPFLAFPVRCGITFTFGGVRVNERAQVLREDGSVIPGLYAAGEMVGGLFYGNYPGGAGLMSGATFGRLAGENITGNE